MKEGVYGEGDGLWCRLPIEALRLVQSRQNGIKGLM